MRRTVSGPNLGESVMGIGRGVTLTALGVVAMRVTIPSESVTPSVRVGVTLGAAGLNPADSVT